MLTPFLITLIKMGANEKKNMRTMVLGLLYVPYISQKPWVQGYQVVYLVYSMKKCIIYTQLLPNSYSSSCCLLVRVLFYFKESFLRYNIS